VTLPRKILRWLTRLAYARRLARATLDPGRLGCCRRQAAVARGAGPIDRRSGASSSTAIAACRMVFRTVFVLRVWKESAASQTLPLPSACTTKPRAHISFTCEQRRLRAGRARRVRAAKLFLELGAERPRRIVQRVLAQLPHARY